jgi:uncharacterized protein YfaS (alpha-2-macroglobulin family)
MLRFHRFILLLCCGLLILSCQRNAVSLQYSNAKDEVPALGNLVFRFNKSLYPDSLLNRWDSTEFVAFEPSIPGRFRWNGPEELIFSPAQPLLPATEYRAVVNRAVLQHSRYNAIDGDRELHFHTAPLDLLDAQVSWVLQEEGRAAVPQIALRFNYPVKAEEVKVRLSISLEGQSTPFVLHTSGTADLVMVRLAALQATDRNHEARVTLAKGLLPVRGGKATAEPLQAGVTIPSPLVLSINSVESEHDGTRGTVRIYTSQQLAPASLSSLITFSPAVTYSVEYHDDGLTLRSEGFDAQSSYSFTIARGLRGRIGGVLKEEYTGNVAFGELESQVSFANSKAVYLSKRGGGNLEVRITNTPKVKLIISKIYENNLLAAERHGYEPAGESEWEDEGGEESPITAGDVIFSKEIDTRSLPRSGSGRLLNLAQFEDRLPDAKGVYHVLIRSATDYWVRDSRLISFSDIGLMARLGKDKMLLFANSLKTASPLTGVNISVYGANNQLLGTGATNADGAAELTLSAREFSGFRPALVVARTADDFTYLPLSSTKVNTSRFEVGGKRANATGFDAFIYAERDIYRPGEQVNFAVLLRDAAWKNPGEMPLKLKFLLPTGKELKAFRKSTNEQGALDGAIALSPAALTGSYTLEVYSSNDVLLAAQSFMVEEFVPDRLKVSAQLDKTVLRPEETTQLRVKAVNFFGPPAAGRNVETEIQVRQQVFRAPRFPGWDFTLDNQREFYDKEVQESKTDSEGEASLSFEVPAMYRNTGLLQVAFYTTVFDETGRPVSRHTTADIFTQDVFHGIRNDGYAYYAINQPVSFPLLSLNREGQPVTAAARIQVIKHEYRTVLTRNGSYFRYASQQQDKVLADETRQLGANAVYSFVPRSPGDYELRVYRPGANAYVSKRFYSYGGWSENASFEVNTEGQIDISTDKESYAPGEAVKLLFKAPFSGRMLVTMETDKVLSHQYVEVSRRTASLSLPLTAAHLPNVYVTATLIKPHELSDIPLTVAHGFQSVRVEEKSRRLEVAITAAKQSRSRTRQTVRVKTAPGSYVTLAAVDNGVLQVSGFKTPDPYGHYYQRRALQVSAYDLYPLLFPERRASLSSTGGDGGLEMDKRVNPMPAKRFKLMSYWSGMRKANGSGIAEFEFEVPSFSGEIRLMAVAFQDHRFGSAEATTTVADPLVVSTALPRFLSPGDTVLVPVTITNTTAKEARGNASLKLTGPLKVVGSSGQSLTIGARSEGRAVFQLVADPTVLVAKVAVQVDALGERFGEETEISIRPPSTLQQRSGSGSVAGGSSTRIELPQDAFVSGSFRYRLVIGRSPVAELAGQLRQLLQYPYGCTEQTISSAFPQLYFADFANLIGMKEGMKANANANVMEAIRKIRMRQLYSGALTLWDGESREDWWTSAYAAHFLLEARKAGFEVENGLLEPLLGYLTNRLKRRELIEYTYNRDQRRKIAPKEVAYSLYVLAIAGRSQVAAMNYYKANTALLALDSRYLLAAAYAGSGDRRSFTALLPAAFAGEEAVQQTGGSFYSALRDEAIALNMLVDVDPGHAQVPVMAGHIRSRLQRERYLNTQERAFSFLALGKLARQAARSTVEGELRSNGRRLAQIRDNWAGASEELKATSLELVTKGEGRMYYSWVAEGISTTGSYTEEDNFVKVRRQFYDRYGKMISGNSFRQNDLVIVELTLDKAYSGSIENIVITDLLPAGFEIENPRTKELPGMEWIRNAATPTALDVRDDRIHFFVDATSARQRYYYAVRAVSPGSYRQGPVSADAMYAGEIHSYHGAQLVRVRQ